MKFWALLAAFAAIGAGIWAAEQKPVVQQPVVQADEPTRIQVDVTRVSLLYTVTDRRGSFVTKAELVSDLIADTEKLATAIRQLRPGGGTSLYDAIFFACRDKLSQDQ